MAAEMVLFGQAMPRMGFWGSWGQLAGQRNLFGCQRWRVPRLLTIPVRCCHSWHFVPLPQHHGARNDSSGMSKT